MARALSVKVPTASVIAQIEKSIAEIDAAVASYPADVEKYKTETETYKAEVAKFITQFVSENVSNIGYESSDLIQIGTNYRNRLELTFDADAIPGFPKRPVEPVKPNQSQWYGNKHINRKEVLEQNLNILRMTTQEEINASSYSTVMDLL